MPTYSTIQQTIAPELERLQRRIMKQLSSDNPLMETIVGTYLHAKGKQIRPVVVILTAKLLGEVNEKVLAAAASVELLHNASLIHDDVVDNSSMRRGKPTINAIWDNHIAVLVGDFFVSSAMQQAIETADIRIVESLCSLGKQLSLGELDQIYNARFHKLTEDAYFRIIASKTASLFVACARMGGYAVGAANDDIDRIAAFAEILGLCFQMRDDLLDYDTTEHIGKPAGNDLREGKITLPLLHALLDEEAPEHEQMLELSRKEELTDREIARLMAFAVERGGIEYTCRKMGELRDKAAELMARFGQSETTEAFMALIDSIAAPN